MAIVYGKKRPGQSGWEDFETSVDAFLEDEVEGFSVTYEMRQNAWQYDSGELEQRANIKRNRKRLRRIAMLVWVIGGIVGSLLVVGEQVYIGAWLILASVAAFFYLMFSFIFSMNRKVEGNDTSNLKANTTLEQSVEDRRKQEAQRLTAMARQGYIQQTGLPAAFQRAAQGYRAEEQIGLMLEQRLPDPIEIAHDVIIHRDGRDGLTKILDGMRGVEQPLMYGTTPTARKFGLAMGIFGALGELTARNATTANADHILSTAAGLIMVDTKHWTGELSLDSAGQFTAGPNHPGSEYREKAADVTRFEASRINRGDVSVIILAVVGGSVQDKFLLQERDGEVPIVAVEAEDVADAIIRIHNDGRLRAPVSLKSVEYNSPGTTW